MEPASLQAIAELSMRYRDVVSSTDRRLSDPGRGGTMKPANRADETKEDLTP